MTKKKLNQLLALLQEFTLETGADTKYVQDCVNDALDFNDNEEDV